MGQSNYEGKKYKNLLFRSPAAGAKPLPALCVVTLVIRSLHCNLMHCILVLPLSRLDVAVGAQAVISYHFLSVCYQEHLLN